MQELIVVFVGGQSLVDKVIQHVSKGEEDNITHVALLMLDSTIEALGIKDESDPYPGVWLHRPDKYYGNIDAKFISIEVPNIDGGKEVARQLLGVPYGYTDCIKTAIYELLQEKLPDTDFSAMCAETGVRIIRGSGIEVLPELEPGSISPVRLYHALTSLYGGIDVTDRYLK